MKNPRQAALERPLLYDGSKGVMLQRLGLTGGEASELWNVTHADRVREVHAGYAAAGADVIQTNTFPGNPMALARHGLAGRCAELNAAGVRLAREAAGPDRWVAASVGPTGELFEPAGDLTFDKAYELYADHAAMLATAGADLLHFETFGDLAELRCAILAARERTGLPVVASATFEGGGRTLSGNTPQACAVACEAAGAAFVGANCSTGPEDMVPVISAMAAAASGPLVAKANAGMPEVVAGAVVYRETPQHFASFTDAFLQAGVRLLGGCCGTTPEFIAEMRRRIDAGAAAPLAAAERPLIASAFAVEAMVPGLALGEIGPAEAASGDSSALADRARELAQAGARCVLIDLGAGADKWDPAALAGDLALFVRLPLVLCAENAAFLEALVRRYPGRPAVVGGACCGALAVTPQMLRACARVGG